MGFINEQSFKCLLGAMSKNVIIYNDMYMWQVKSKQHFCTAKKLSINDLDYLKGIIPFNFHYLSEENMLFLKQNFKVSRDKIESIVLNISDLTLSGSKYKKIRNAYNYCEKQNFTILNEFKSIDDVKTMIRDWSDNYSDKYFRNMSGKNLFFFRSGYHERCINIFIYSDNQLLSYGSLSQPIDGESTYIIGKALYKRCHGLSEYTDLKLYELAQSLGIKRINMGQALKGLMFYKSKFPGSMEEISYHGSAG